MKFVLILAAAVLAMPVRADDLNCKDPQDQHSMNRCADRNYQAADAKLNAAYAKLMGTLGHDSMKTKLKAAQRAWISFRDAECTFQTADNEGGSIHPMVYSGCLTRLTKERTKALDAQTACWKDAEKCGM